MVIDVLWSSTIKRGLPHAGLLCATNPGVRQHSILVQEGATPEEVVDGWRNCDRQIRQWWKDNRHRVDATHLLVLEWDVRVSDNIYKYFSDQPGLQAARYVGPASVDAGWESELNNMPDWLLSSRCGIRPLAVMHMSRECLDAIIDPIYDDVYISDIFCEVRTPTVAHHAGFPISYNRKLLGTVRAGKVYIHEKGIHHAIKP